MKALAYLWDFGLGVLSLGAAPVFAWVGISQILGSMIANPWIAETAWQAVVCFLVDAVYFLVPIGAFAGALAWRKQRRVLPFGFIWAEAPLGLLGGAAFLFFRLVANVWTDPTW